MGRVRASGRDLALRSGFSRPLERLTVRQLGRSGNAGVEGLATDGGELLLFKETGGRLLRIGTKRARIEQIGGARRISDAAGIGPGRVVVIERRPTLLGFRNQLVELERTRSGYRRTAVLPLPAAPIDNFEGLAVERTAGGTRLWLVSDDSFQKPFRTVLLALDLKPAAKPPGGI